MIPLSFTARRGAGLMIGCLAAIMLTACPAEDRPAAVDTPAPPAVPGPPVTGEDAALIALGDSIFHGRAAGGICFTCHGQQGAGTQLAPSLLDGEWLHGDGTLPSIENTIRTGVAQPIQAPAMMPPMGGTPLDERQLRAVAMYVHSVGGR